MRPAERLELAQIGEEVALYEPRPSPGVGPLNGLVSVITPAHNASAVIVRAIEAVATQTVGVLEHIIIDDGSRDDTSVLVQSLQEHHPHIRYVRQPWRGAARARNLGIELARGRYIAFLDSDDFWRPRKLENQISFMEHQGALFTYGDYLICEPASGRILHERRAPEQLSHQDLLARCPIGCLTAVYNQERLGKVYMPQVRRGQDWGLWLEITRRGIPAMKYPGLEAVYYARRGSLSSRKLLKCLDVYRIYRRQEKLAPVPALWNLARFSWSSLHRWKR
jgi:teichuronic acid biosynthesis glycosyltransferase TuaG